MTDIELNRKVVDILSYLDRDALIIHDIKMAIVKIIENKKENNVN